MKQKTIYRAWYVSSPSHFEFDSYSDSEAKAVKILKQGLKRWKEQNDLEDSWYDADDISTSKITMDNAYMDNHICLTH